MVLCNQKVAYCFPENETIAIKGGLLFPRERDHCIQMLAYYFSGYGNFSNIWCFAIRRWLIISQRTRPLQSGTLQWELCYKMVVNYFPKYGNIAIRCWLIISECTGTLLLDGG